MTSIGRFLPVINNYKLTALGTKPKLVESTGMTDLYKIYIVCSNQDLLKILTGQVWATTYKNKLISVALIDACYLTMSNHN